MIKSMRKASPSHPKRALPASPGVALVFALLVATTPVQAATDDIVCEMTSDGLVKCRRPKPVGGDGTLHQRDDIRQRLENSLSKDIETNRQVN